MTRSRMRILAARCLLALLPALAACAAPAPQAADADAVAQAGTRPRIGQKIDLPPMSHPHPPARVGDRAPVQVDRSCRTDADCAVKNVGNCCGAMPACVNKDSPTDPAGVQAQCAKEGMVSVCGFAEMEGCRCTDNQCTPAVAPLDPSQDPPVPVR